MVQRMTRTAVAIVVLLSAAGHSALLEAGTGRLGYAAVHVVPHGTSCKSLPSLDYCYLINTAFIGTGDVDVIPVFFELCSYTAVEFGLSWPADWGSCSFVSCGTGTVAGTIRNPGDGIIKAWSTCQTRSSVPLGYGWLTAGGSGRVELVDPPWGKLGVLDCADTLHPLFGAFSAGVGWIPGDEPCLPARDPLIVEVSDAVSGSCVATGDTSRYAVRVTNFNMYDVHDVVLVDSLPAGTVYLSGGTYDEETRVLRLALGTVESGYDTSAAFSLEITAPAGSVVTNHFVVTCREYWPRPATHSRQVCEGPATEPTTWGQIKAIFR